MGCEDCSSSGLECFFAGGVLGWKLPLDGADGVKATDGDVFSATAAVFASAFCLNLVLRRLGGEDTRIGSLGPPELLCDPAPLKLPKESA